MSGAYAIVSGGGNNRLSPKDAAQASILGALAVWRVTQGIYRGLTVSEIASAMVISRRTVFRYLADAEV